MHNQQKWDMSASNEKPDIINNKIKLINANYVPDSFVTSLNETYEWIWLPHSDANQLITIRNAKHVLLNTRNTLPITMKDHLNFLERYNSFQRIDFVLVDKDSRQYVGGMNISQTSHGFEIGKYIGNKAYLGKRIAYQMSFSFIAFVKKNSTLTIICSATLNYLTLKGENFLRMLRRNAEGCMKVLQF